jgi:hypothetical protein
MNNRTQHRGSALLMVVGLLAIICMLGTSFLLISRLSRKESTALSIAAPLNPAAEGLISEAAGAILADLHISKDGFPYARASEPGELVDSPWTGSAAENWLSPNNPTDKKPDPTDVGDPKKVDWRFTRLGSFTPIENKESGATTQYVHVDTMGDGVDDAYLFETGQVDITGRKYYGAIRIMCLSAYINVNVASQSPASLPQAEFPNLYCPTLVNLAGFITPETQPIYAGPYGDLSVARAGAMGSSPTKILDNISLCLLNPGVGYTPFAITDELSLRWLGGKTKSMTGPLWEAIKGVEEKKRSQLTTYSVSRSLTRPTGMADTVAPPTVRWLLDKSHVSTDLPAAAYGELRVLTEDLANNTDANRFYKLLEEMTGDATIAGHVTANMFAFTQGPNYTKAYAFKPTGGDTTYYGAQPDLVISEAYAAHVPKVAETETVEAAPGYVGYAIELFNPTTQSIALSNYSLGKKGGVSSTQIPGGKTIIAGGRQVIYYFDVDPVEEAAELTDAEKAALKKIVFGIDPFPTEWIEMSVVDFRGGGLALIRNAENEKIQVDEVTHDKDLAYTLGSGLFPAEGSGEVSKNARRDDNTDRARYNVAKYKQTSGSFDNKLDKSNALEDTDLPDVYTGFSVPTKTDYPPYSLVDLMECIYTTGSASTDGIAGGSDVFTKKLADIGGDERSLRGKVDFAKGTNYENVPWPAMLGEFVDVVPPDFYRRDEIGEGLKEYPSRVYGRININTASKEVLAQLPWPETLDVNCDGVDDASEEVDPAALAQLIVDERGEGGFFLSTGQVSAILLKHVDGGEDADGNPVAGLIAPDTRKSKFYPTVRNDLYSSIASSITVRSDTFAVFILIGLGNEDEDGNPDPDNWRTTRRYFGVIDRSNCLTSEDTPATLMFSEILASPK